MFYNNKKPNLPQYFRASKPTQTHAIFCDKENIFLLHTETKVRWTFHSTFCIASSSFCSRAKIIWFNVWGKRGDGKFSNMYLNVRHFLKNGKRKTISGFFNMWFGFESVSSQWPWKDIFIYLIISLIWDFPDVGIPLISLKSKSTKILKDTSATAISLEKNGFTIAFKQTVYRSLNIQKIIYSAYVEFDLLVVF